MRFAEESARVGLVREWEWEWEMGREKGSLLLVVFQFADHCFVVVVWGLMDALRWVAVRCCSDLFLLKLLRMLSRCRCAVRCGAVCLFVFVLGGCWDVDANANANWKFRAKVKI